MLGRYLTIKWPSSRVRMTAQLALDEYMLVHAKIL